MTAKKFKNFTDQDFTYSFDKIPYNFPAGSEIFLEDYKADHFAKHLVDRELNRLNIVTSNVLKRAELTAKCFPTDEVVTPQEALDVNEKVKIAKKRGRPKKVVEEEFEDLK